VRASTTATLDIDGVAPDSRPRLRRPSLEIENWRWAGVPFFIRTGKRLPVDADGAAARVQASHRASASLVRQRPEPNQLVVRLDPTTGIRLVVQAHRADAAGLSPIELDMEFEVQGARGRHRTRCSCTPR
jgi:glucose-6-phosphate 1-dehydrogenase